MGNRDARSGGNRDRACHARYDLDRDPGRSARLDLLMATPEHKRVSALEPRQRGYGEQGLVAPRPVPSWPAGRRDGAWPSPARMPALWVQGLP
jgi:hypothetical protein